MTKVFNENKNSGFRDTVNRKSVAVLSSNIEWLLKSNIRVKNGNDKGALYGWKYLNPPSYPFVYSEITGYAISCYSWICSELGKPEALPAAREAAQWIVRKMDSEFLLVVGYRKQDSFVEKGDISNHIYLFDNGMAIIGLLNLYRLTAKKDLLQFASKMADSLIRHFFKGSAISTVLLDKFYRPIELKETKWSTVPGAYLSKLSLGLLELSKLTGKTNYVRISNAICNFAVSLQKPDGRFETNPNSQITYLHPHLYACEGLIYSGVIQSKEKYLNSALQGIVWATRHLNDAGGLPRDNSKVSVEQSDAICQLLRLLILCRLDLSEMLGQSQLANLIDRLHQRILDFCMMSRDDNRGGVKYQLRLESICSWCTMFCMQAVRLWQKKTNGQLNDNVKWIEYFV
jgi:uncharacterized protein YyaL (SSP411 family)